MNREIKERTKWFMDARFGMFIHWGLYSIPACGEWVMSQKEMTIEEYRKYFEQFDPVDYDPKTWVRLAKEAGARAVVPDEAVDLARRDVERQIVHRLLFAEGLGQVVNVEHRILPFSSCSCFEHLFDIEIIS